MITLVGGAGFIGSRVAQQLASQEVPYYVIDSFRRGRMGWLPPNTLMKRWDIRDPGLTIPDNTTRLVFLASLWLRQSEHDPHEAIQVNVGGVRRVWDACPKTLKRVIYVSSASVYGEPEMVPTPETAPLRPTTVYGWTKVYAERMIQAYCTPGWASRDHQTACVILRPFNVYGPGQDTYGAFTQVLPIWAEALLQGREVQVYDDGLQTMDMIYVDDVARAIVHLCMLKEEGVFNVGSGEATSVRTLADRLVEHALRNGPRHDLDVVGGGYVAPKHLPQQRRRQADITRLTQTGWTPTVSLDHGLGQFWNWYRQEHHV